MRIDTQLTRVLSSEETLLALFVAAVIVVYLAAIIVVMKLAWRLFTGDRTSVFPGRLDSIILTSALIGCGLMAYAYFWEPYSLEVTHIRICSDKIPEGARPVRLLHITDIHSDPSPRLEKRLPEVISREKPDLILFTGDAINHPGAAPLFKQLSRQMSAIAPTYVVEGNHDSREYSRLKLFDDTGVHELKGRPVTVSVRGVNVCLWGVGVDSEWKLEKLASKLPANTFSVFLYHFPAKVYDIAREKVDLFLAGHTHGGQVRLPFYGAIITRSKTGKKFEQGMYRVDGTWLYVNKGIGMEDKFPRFRFLAKPELTVFDIQPQS